MILKCSSRPIVFLWIFSLRRFVYFFFLQYSIGDEMKKMKCFLFFRKESISQKNLSIIFHEDCLQFYGYRSSNVKNIEFHISFVRNDISFLLLLIEPFHKFVCVWAIGTSWIAILSTSGNQYTQKKIIDSMQLKQGGLFYWFHIYFFALHG